MPSVQRSTATHKICGSRPPFSYSADGAEMGKLMVAEGLGAAVLPDYSVHDDPLERSDTITYRPLADDNTGFRVVLQRRHAHMARTAAHDLHSTLVRQAERRRANLPARRKRQR
ncbi:LysR substrate-binding domain-containing protein [Streptomyces sp. NPDC045456]|uniref:LysR substrate-binding domain-containing protein n=1 Tax=Streptomyces sp. NPDC045456 TaxID=3155254 RepID=UPI0033ECCED2